MWKSIATQSKEIFFPKRCFFCKKYGDLLCSDCQSLLDVSPVHRPDHNKKNLADIYAACSYENKYVQKIIRGLKYAPFHKELGRSLGQLIAAHFALAEQNFDFSKFIIVPVPLAAKRLRWRGFNQAEIIARNLGDIWQIPTSTDSLIRIKETKNQADLGQEQRRQNIKGAFACTDNAPFKNRLVFIVDDVVTTGATMNECARILLRRGAKSVIGLSAARTENS